MEEFTYTDLEVPGVAHHRLCLDKNTLHSHFTGQRVSLHAQKRWNSSVKAEAEYAKAIQAFNAAVPARLAEINRSNLNRQRSVSVPAIVGKITVTYDTVSYQKYLPAIGVDLKGVDNKFAVGFSIKALRRAAHINFKPLFS